MTAEQVTMVQLRCDNCGEIYGYEEGDITLFASFDDAEAHLDHIDNADEFWTVDGEGHLHCPICPPLVLTDVGRAELARKAHGPDEVPLPGLEVPDA